MKTVFTLLVTLATVTVTFATALPEASVHQNGKKMVCYFGSWSSYREGNRHFDVEDIDPHLCTHVIYSFAGLGEDNKLKVLDPQNDLEENGGRGAMKRFTGLKRQNPELKTMLAIGGGNEGSAKYSDMARDPAKRRIFVESVVSFLQSQNFDGLDLDWEYPANREGSRPEDKQNFVLLINELKAAFAPHGYLLSAAVSTVVRVVDTGYDIPAISRGLDFINLMCYDFHGSWEDATGHHSALGSNPAIDRGVYGQLNANFSVNYWIEGGAPPEKLVLGMGTYGVGWILDNANNHGLYAPASESLPLTGYNDLCEQMRSEQGQWTIETDEFYQTPYAYNLQTRHWVGYDSKESVGRKARFITQKGLGGGMVWSIEQDDFRGLCGDGSFPLIKNIRNNF